MARRFTRTVVESIAYRRIRLALCHGRERGRNMLANGERRLTKPGTAGRGTAGPGTAGRGGARQGAARLGTARHGKAREKRIIRRLL